ncbi:MAG: glucokinase [Pseudanabaenaceae cyanobacterium]
MSWILAGDVGATKTLLCLIDTATGSGVQARYLTADFPSLQSMLHVFYEKCNSELAIVPKPECVCLGVAAPVQGDRACFTNLDLVVDAEELRADLQVPQVRLINDFVATAYGILTLSPTDLYCLQEGTPRPCAPIVVLGAGTGLGQAYLTWAGDRYQVHPSEGSHSQFAPQNQTELELLQWLWQRYPHASVERVVSGQGIVNIYEFFASVYPDLPRLDLANSAEPAGLIAAAVSTNQLATYTMGCFVSAYGAEAGNLAVKFLPYGGLYIAGGIAPKILPLLTEEGRFLQAMRQKEKMQQLLCEIPTYIVLNPEVGLLGTIDQAKQMLV